jgi:hypothetical protein
MPEHEQHGPLDPPHAHEESDVSIAGLAVFLGGLVATIVVVFWLLVGMFDVLLREAREADPPAPPLVDLRGKPVGPELQPSASADMREFRAQEEAALHRWQWVDQPQEVAEIPIERAIELVAKNGLPQWPAVAPPAQPAEAKP